MNERIIGHGSIISENTIFKGTVYIGHYVLIGDKSSNDNQSVVIGNNVNIGSFTIIEKGVLIGNNSVIDHNCLIYSNVQIGNNSKILYGAKIFSNSIIGNYCIVGKNIPERMTLEDNVTFMGNIAHSYRDASRDWDSTEEPSPIIGKGSIVGVGSILIGDIRIGKNCYVSAGEVLRHDLPDNSVFLKNKIYPINFFKGLIKTRY